MTELLPALPSRAEATLERIEMIERHVVANVIAVDDLDALGEWLDQANALTAYLRGRELHGPMLGAARHIEARIGQLLGPPPGRGRSEMNEHAHSFDTRFREEFRILARALNGDVKLGDEDWRTSRRTLVQVVRAELGYTSPELPAGTWSTIVADPPWHQEQTDTWGADRGASAPLPYRTMPLGDIERLAVEERAADNAHLYLWVTNRYLGNAFGIVRAWGFNPSTTLVWCKPPRGLGLGGAYTLTTEYLIYARRGSLDPLRRVDSSWFAWPRRGHSVKPEEFYELVESVSPGPYLELFARRPRPGWDTWGDEL